MQLIGNKVAYFKWLFNIHTFVYSDQNFDVTTNLMDYS
jgi:hypothetical protein